MSHIPNSAMPHAGTRLNGVTAEPTLMERASQQAGRIAGLAREYPRATIAAGAAVAAGVAAAAAIPIARARRAGASSGAKAKAGSAKAGSAKN